MVPSRVVKIKVKKGTQEFRQTTFLRPPPTIPYKPLWFVCEVIKPISTRLLLVDLNSGGLAENTKDSNQFIDVPLFSLDHKGRIIGIHGDTLLFGTT